MTITEAQLVTELRLAASQLNEARLEAVNLRAEVERLRAWLAMPCQCCRTGCQDGCACAKEPVP